MLKSVIRLTLIGLLAVGVAGCQQVGDLLSDKVSTSSDGTVTSISSIVSTNTDLIVTTTGGVTSLVPGAEIALIAKKGDQVVTNSVTFIITAGEDYATLNNVVLKINQDAPVNRVIKIVAKEGNSYSEPVEITVAHVRATAINLTANKATVLAGDEVIFTATLTPSNSTETAEFAISYGEEHATLSGNRLTIKEDAATDSVIKVVAKIGSLLSNELTFTVLAPVTDATFIVLDSSKITLDIFGSSNPKITATVFNSNLKIIENAPLVMRVQEGGEGVLAIGENNTLVAVGHGRAVVEVTVPGSSAPAATCTVDVVVPPTHIDLQDLLNSSDRVVNFGKRKVDGSKDSIILDVEPSNPNYSTISTDFNVRFRVNGEDNTTFATFNQETNEITFADEATGVVEVIVSSVSGSSREAIKTFRINVNEGVNAYTFEQFAAALDCGDYQSTLIDGNYHDVCVSYATPNAYPHKTVNLLNNVAKTFVDDTTGTEGEVIARINNTLYWQRIRVAGGATINGNGFRVDVSKAVVDPDGEPIEVENVNSYSLIDFHGPADYSVEINDLDIYSASDADFASGFNRAIRIYTEALDSGKEWGYGRCTDFTLRNSYIEGFNTKISMFGIYNGLIENTDFGKGSETHMNLKQANMTLRNVSLGPVGANAITLEPTDSSKAGINRDQTATLNLAGNISLNNLHSTETRALASTAFFGLTVLEIMYGFFINPDFGAITGLTPQQAEEAATYIVNQEKKMNWLIYKCDAFDTYYGDIQAGKLGTGTEPIAAAANYVNHYVVNTGSISTTVYNQVLQNPDKQLISVEGDFALPIAGMGSTEAGLISLLKASGVCPTKMQTVFVNLKL